MKVKEFNLPDGVSEEAKKGLASIASWMTDNFNQFVEGQVTKEELIESITMKLEEQGFKGEILKNLQESVKLQGEAITKLKERAVSGGVELNNLQQEFYKNFDALKDAIKSRKQGFEIKAIDEHNPALIHTTANTVTTTSGAILQESIANDPNFYLKRRDRQYIHDIANVSYVNEVPEIYTFWEEGDETGAIAVVAENGLKPQIKLSLIKNQVEAQKAAGYIVVTEELMKWRPRAWAAIQRLFRDKVYRDYENLLTTQMIGNASAYVGTPLDGTIPAAQVNDFTAIIATLAQLESLNIKGDTLVIHSTDKWRLALTQTNNGMFVLPYIQEGGQFGLLGLRVITSNKITPGTFLIGESGTWNIEEESPTLRTGLVNDDLIHNRMTIVGEIYFLSYVASNNAGAWINGDFTAIKNALTAA